MEPHSLSQLVVLVADDNSFVRHMLRASLGGYGLRRLVECRDGFEAIEAAKRFRPHIMLLDVVMPGLDGFEVTRMIRSTTDGSQFTPIILVSAEATREKVMRTTEVGAHEFITKPFSPAAIFDRIDNLVSTPRPFIRTRTYFGPVPHSREMLEKLRAQIRPGTPDGMICVETAAAPAPDTCGFEGACRCRRYVLANRQLTQA